MASDRRSKNGDILMKHPVAIALLFTCLTPLLAGAQTWSIETVQPHGAYFDLAVDGAGSPHIA